MKKIVIAILALSIALSGCGKKQEVVVNSTISNGAVSSVVQTSSINSGISSTTTTTSSVNSTITSSSNVSSKNGSSSSTTSSNAATTVEATGITIDTPTKASVIGKTIPMKAVVSPANVTNKSVTWKSSNEAIAKVDANGNVSTIALGTASITATTINGKTVSTVVNVARKIDFLGPFCYYDKVDRDKYFVVHYAWDNNFGLSVDELKKYTNMEGHKILEVKEFVFDIFTEIIFKISVEEASDNFKSELKEHPYGLWDYQENSGISQHTLNT